MPSWRERLRLHQIELRVRSSSLTYYVGDCCCCCFCGCCSPPFKVVVVFCLVGERDVCVSSTDLVSLVIHRYPERTVGRTTYHGSHFNRFSKARLLPNEHGANIERCVSGNLSLSLSHSTRRFQCRQFRHRHSCALREISSFEKLGPSVWWYLIYATYGILL